MMQLFVVTAILVATFVAQAVDSAPASILSMSSEQENLVFRSTWPVGDPRRCQEQSRDSNLGLNRFGVLPGGGWDNLRNLETGLVIAYNYSECKVTEDGKLLLPDNVFTIPIKSSHVTTFAEMITSWQNHTSAISNTINIDTGLKILSFKISGSYSEEHEEVKSKMIEDDSVVIRVQLRYLRYEAKLQPDPPLNPNFKARLMSISDHLDHNRTEHARYEGQLLVREFGTHVLSSVTAGAGLAKYDFITRKAITSSDFDKKSYLTTASASFGEFFHTKMSYGRTNIAETKKKYEDKTTNSYIRTFGGPLIEGKTLKEWSDEVDINLVAMDKAGEPLNMMVNTRTLPELPPVNVALVEQIVRHSIEEYYDANTIAGCTQRDAPNFSLAANFDDGSCNEKSNHLSFGGAYQTCYVSGRYLRTNPCESMNLNHKNPMTNGYNCPNSFDPVLLHSNTRRGSTEYEKKCKSCGFLGLGTCCRTHSYVASAVYTTYWCAATDTTPADTGYLFGGLYSSTTENRITGTNSCPAKFYAQPMLYNMHVCISDDDDTKTKASQAVAFGGFFSCTAGNPLTKASVSGSTEDYSKKCPVGYSQHLADTDGGCRVHYCVESGALVGPTLPPAKRPPFMLKPPVEKENGEDEEGTEYGSTQEEIMKNLQNVSAETNNTVDIEIEDQAFSQMLVSLRESHQTPSKKEETELPLGPIAVIGGAVVLVLVVLVVGAVLIKRRRNRRKQKDDERPPTSSSQETDNYN